MHTIWKYTLEPVTELDIPQGAEILSVASQHGQIVLWAKVDPQAPTEKRTIIGFGTGHDIPDNLNLSFIGTVMFSNGNFVFHIFEQV